MTSKRCQHLKTEQARTSFGPENTLGKKTAILMFSSVFFAGRQNCWFVNLGKGTKKEKLISNPAHGNITKSTLNSVTQKIKEKKERKYRTE